MANQILPRFRDVTKVNPANVIYIKGRENLDGSIRLVPDSSHDITHFECQLRANGVWNITSIDLSGEIKTHIGDGLMIGAGGAHLVSSHPRDGSTYVHSHLEFDDASGSVESSLVPKIGPKILRSVIQPDWSAYIRANLIAWTTIVDDSKLLTTLILRTGRNYGDPITLTVRENDANGNIYFIHRYGAEQLEFEHNFDLHGWINTEDRGGIVYWEIAVDNGGLIEIYSDVAKEIPWYAFDYYTETHQHLAPMEYVTDSYIFESITLEQLLTTEGNMITTCPTIEI